MDMATRSTIGILNGDNSVTSIYCHWDGYPEGVGATLREHYTATETITNLMALGDLSALGDTIGTQKKFTTAALNAECLAYGRDRGETGVEARTHGSAEAWVSDRRGSHCEYGYLWNGITWETTSL
jgi:hypothetical protein